MSRTAEERASWLKASCCQDETEGTQTALPEKLCREKKGTSKRAFSACLQRHTIATYRLKTSYVGEKVMI